MISGEAVAVDVRVARVGSRTLAFLIDLCIQVSVIFVLVIGAVAALSWLAARGVAVDSALVIGVMTLIVLIGFLGYPIAMTTLTGGLTVGKLALGLRVVRDDGGPITFRHALTRGLIAFAVEFPGLALPGVTWLATVGTMIANPQGKRLGDLAAGTLVLHERTPAAWGLVPQMPPSLHRWARLLDLTALPDDLALTVRHYLTRNRSLREPHRTHLGRALAAEVAQHITPPPPAGTPGWAYLAAVLAERHRRSAALLTERRAIIARVWTDPASPALGLGRLLPERRREAAPLAR